MPRTLFSEFAQLHRLRHVVLAGRGIPDLIAGLPKTRSAPAYAEQLHLGQRRGVDGAPFILHPIEVASLLDYAGAADHVIAAGALHDTIEKTAATASMIRKQFGRRITELVLAVTEDAQITRYKQRKAALRQQVARAGEEALMIFAADKISKARELSLEAGKDGPGKRPASSRSRDRRLVHYHHCPALLDELLTESPLVRQLRAELEKPASVRPGRWSPAQCDARPLTAQSALSHLKPPRGPSNERGLMI